MKGLLPHVVPEVLMLSRLTAAITSVLALACFAAAPANAQQVRVETALDHSVLQANQKQTAYLRTALTGFDLPGERGRAPLNVAIVIDKSGSMQGTKIEQAKAAARAALAQLRDDDIVAIVAYDDTVEVLVPATKASDRASIERGIARLSAGGMTALFGGVVKGATEVRKFMTRDRVNRVVLLSDGAANVGPASASELGQLGRSLRKEGIAVTTIGLGLGYNEDLMVQLAQASGGQHVFIEHERQLAQVFKEGFGNLASIVAKEVVVKIRLAEGLRPVKVLGRAAESIDIVGQEVTVQMPALYARQLDDLVLELEVRPLPPQNLQVATVDVSYHNVATNAADKVSMALRAEITDDRERWSRSEVPAVRVAVLERVANEQSRQAIELRDQGRVEEAKRLMQDNAKTLHEGASKYGSDTLDKLSKEYDFDADNLEGEQWNRQRKVIQRRNVQSPYQLEQNNF